MSSGGIGNQMLQYSLFLKLKSLNYNCKFYKKPDHMNDNHGFDIDCIFKSILIDKKSRYILNYYISFYEFVNKIECYISKRFNIEYLILSKYLPIQIINFPHWNDYTFLKNLLTPIHEIFDFPKLISVENIKILNLISTTNSISIHIRRGDYVTNYRWRSILGDICDLDYYYSAINLIKKSIKSPVFFIFSDDVDWVKENLILDNCYFINWNLNNQSYLDMKLMASCKHNIIANSTFSLMAAWLNTNPNKQIFGPKKWKNCFKDNSALKLMDPHWKIIYNDRPNISIICEIKLKKNDLLNILNQSYSDFEILLHLKYKNLIFDERIKDLSISSTSGVYIIVIDQNMLSNFSSRNYLGDLLIKNYP